MLGDSRYNAGTIRSHTSKSDIGDGPMVIDKVDPQETHPSTSSREHPQVTLTRGVSSTPSLFSGLVRRWGERYKYPDDTFYPNRMLGFNLFQLGRRTHGLAHVLWS